MTQDDNRANFLAVLNRTYKEKGLRLSNFELSFMDSNLDRMNFSSGQRSAIDKMIGKYQDQIGFNQAGASLAARAEDEKERLKMIARKNPTIIVGDKIVVAKPRVPLD